ncbi:MAG: hypothetical protein U9R25_14135 [Chloroflexota bacterium]|nr:hypothetical protein [Chloroflexota bacterium]
MTSRGTPDAPKRDRRAARLTQWLLPVLVLLLLIPAFRPLWQPGLQQMDDGMHHLFRLFNLDLALRSGNMGARWLADEGFAYGFPVLNFYAPLSYYAGLLFHYLGAGFVTTLELSLAIGLVLAALAMFLFAREFLGTIGGAIAAVAYTWAPYHLADAWTRGALAEHLAFVWFPLLLLAILRIARADGGKKLVPVLWGSLSLAGLALTHNLSLILIAPVLISWTLFLLFVEGSDRTGRWHTLGAVFVMALLGALMSAMFWLPAILESPAIWAGNVELDFEQWAKTLVRPPLLIDQSWIHRYTVSQGVQTLHSLGLAQLVAALSGLAVGIWRWRHLDRTVRLALPLFAVVAVLALFMQSSLSRPVWQHVPGLILLQFPWRWQAIAALALAVVTGYAGFAPGVPASCRAKTDRSRGKSPESRPGTGLLAGAILVTAIGLLLISAALPAIPWESSTYPASREPVTNQNVSRRTMAKYDFGRGLWLREHGSAWMFEYMPAWVTVPRSEFFLSAGPSEKRQPPLDVQVIPGRQAPMEQRFVVSAGQPWTMQLHQFYFPGWQVLLDGESILAEPAGPLALVSVSLPAGDHELVFRFGTTPLRSLGWVLTAIGWGLWLAGVLWMRRWRWVLGLLILFLVYGGLVLAQRQQEPAGVVPVPQNVNFGDEARLIGYHAPPEKLQSDGDGAVTLTWLALQRPAADYKVFVHLLDASGKLWAQHDGEPGYFFSPTTRWQQGEVVIDIHELEWLGQPPPGRYQLRAGLYDPVTGNRLKILGPDGVPTDDQVLLVEFDLE